MKIPKRLAPLLMLAGGALLLAEPVSAREAKISTSLGTGIYLSALNEPLFEFKGSVGIDRKYIGGGFNLAYVTGRNGDMNISLSRLEALAHFNLPIGKRINLRAEAGGALISRSEKVKKIEGKIIEGPGLTQDPIVTYGTDMLAIGPAVTLGVDVLLYGVEDIKLYADFSWSSAGVKTFNKDLGGFSGVIGIGKRL